MQHFSFSPITAPVPEPHRVVVSPAKDAPGHCRVVLKDGPGGEDEEIVASGREPTSETVRALRELGADSGEILEVFREGRAEPDITGNLDWFAQGHATPHHHARVPPRAD